MKRVRNFALDPASDIEYINDMHLSPNKQIPGCRDIIPAITQEHIFSLPATNMLNKPILICLTNLSIWVAGKTLAQKILMFFNAVIFAHVITHCTHLWPLS